MDSVNIYHFSSWIGIASMQSDLPSRIAHMSAAPETVPPMPPSTPRLPARHDHVGSFLRPDYLLGRARNSAHAARSTPPRCAQVEDRAIAEIVRFQESVGTEGITDGEYRRSYFHIDFLDQLGGVEDHAAEDDRASADGSEALAPPVIRVTGKVRHERNIEVDNYRYLKSQVSAGSRAKVAIPSPTMLHFRGGRDGISREAYPELEPAFYDDVARAYGDELQALAAAGCRYVQLDDTNLAYLCDPKMREAARARGDDPDELPRRYADFVNGGRAQARRHAAGHAPVPRQLQEHACRQRRLRAGGRGAAVADEYRCLFPGIRRRAQWRLPPAALPAEGQDRGARTDHHQDRRAGEARTTSSAASTRRRSTCRWSSSRCRRNAVSPAPPKAMPSAGTTSAASWSWWSKSQTKSGATASSPPQPPTSSGLSSATSMGWANRSMMLAR